MSQHEFEPKSLREGLSVAVGWDPALDTYYAQVRDYSISRDDDCVILWLTPRPREIQTVKQLQRALNQKLQGKFIVSIPWRLRLQLSKDKRAGV